MSKTSEDNIGLQQEEKLALEKLKNELKGTVKLPSDDQLLKWIRGYSFDISKAAIAYKKNVAWRKEVGADEILYTYEAPEVLHKYYPGGICGVDKFNRPVVFDPIGQMDMRGILMSSSKSDIMRYLIFRTEIMQQKLRHLTAQTGSPVQECIQILDLEGFGTRQMWIPGLYLFIDVLTMIQENYPETLGTSYILHAPRIFNIAFNFIKGFLDQKTASKFVFLDANWKERLLDVIPASQLPVHYGGSRTDPDGDPKCSLEINYGGKVPLSYLRAKDDFFPPEGSKSVTIGRFTKLHLEVQVLSNCHTSAIRYIFATDSSGIKFGILFKPASNITTEGQVNQKMTKHKRRKKGSKNGNDEDAELDVLISPSEVSCHLIPEDGLIICQHPGTYILEFDNRSSWFTKRKLKYHVSVQEIDETSKTIQSTAADVMEEQIAEIGEDEEEAEEEERLPGQVFTV